MLEFLLPLGSCLHMTPLYEALKRERPSLSITVATRGIALQVLRHSPFVDHLIEAPDPLRDLWPSIRELVRQLKARGLRPDCCLTGVPDQRTRISLLALFSCRGWRGGFTVHPSLYQRPLFFDENKSQIVNNLRLLECFGLASEPIEPKVFHSAEDAEAARALLEPALADRMQRKRPVLVVVARGGGGQPTGWRDDCWVHAIRHAHEVLGFLPVFVGTASDAPQIEALRKAVGVGISIAGRTDVGELAAVLSLADLVVSLDTGTMHIGRAVGVPMVVLGPSWQRPHEWLPLGKPNVRILRGPDRVGVPAGYRLDEISAEAVISAMHDLTRLYPASAEARETRLANGLSTVDLLAAQSNPIRKWADAPVAPKNQGRQPELVGAK